MATAKVIDIFGMLNGLDFHLALEPAEGESGLDVLIKATKYLADNGALPRVQLGRGGWKSSQARELEPIPENCPDCKSAISAKSWTSKDKKTFTIHACPKNQEHFKRFVPVAAATVKVQAG